MGLGKYTTRVKRAPHFCKEYRCGGFVQLDWLADIIDHESEIFSLEEDGYSFKKHVLYYSQTELNLLNEIDTRDFANLIKDQK
ncbi:ABC-three component system middle component 1 [Vibrio parahaemolyticus]